VPSPVATPSHELLLPGVLGRHEFGKTILVVEDDPFVRSAACELLRELGFEILEAQNSAAARHIFFFDHARVDLVVCDAVLPDGCGIELCRHLQRGNNAPRVILTSGYPLDTKALSRNSEAHFLKKPYSGDSLIKTLHKILGTECASGEVLPPRSMADGLQNVTG